MSGIIEATNLQTANIKHTNGTTAATVSSGGVVTFNNEPSGIGNTPCFYATFSSNLNNQSNNVAVKIPFNATSFNQGGGTFDTSNYRWTPSVAGVYQIGATVNLKDYGNDSHFQQQNVSIRKNGTDVYYNRIQLNASYFQGDAYNPILTVLGLVRLDADDYVEVWGSIYGGNFDVHSNGSRFYGFRLVGTV